MSRDAYLNTSSGSSDARRAFEQAVYALAAHRPSTGMALRPIPITSQHMRSGDLQTSSSPVRN
ncbi:hypothetical protein [Rhizobium ruizarguesonis]|jgi:hypothetical protein|uniref:hypothetical protein n=1 Tax=Rhizobium ruizarguesonis TaxID=2081791 RepID=UPI000360D552|nr:hypothetical protein [Rhizobium ruizarguesonis]